MKPIIASTPFKLFSTPANPSVPIALIKELRNRIGAPMNECRDSLFHVLKNSNGQTQNDEQVVQAAIEYLRSKGGSVAVSKSSKTASEGVVAISLSGEGQGLLFEVNSETDFASRNPDFLNVVHSIVKSSDNQIEKLFSDTLSQPYPNNSFIKDVTNTLLSLKMDNSNSSTVNESITSLVSKIREKIALRRAAAFSFNKDQMGVIGIYMHNSIPEYHNENIRMGRSGAIVALEYKLKKGSTGLSEEATGSLKGFGNKLAMHIVAAKTKFLSIEEIPKEILENEKNIFLQQIQALPANKTSNPNINNKIMEGKLNKFYEENVLGLQKFLVVTSPDEKPQTINKLLLEQAKLYGVDSLNIRGFIRFQVGEGVQVQNKMSFADEVNSKLNK